MSFDFLYNLPVVASVAVLLAACLYLAYHFAFRYDIGNCFFWLLWGLAVFVDIVLSCFALFVAVEEMKKLPAPWPTIMSIGGVLVLIAAGVIKIWPLVGDVIRNPGEFLPTLTVFLIIFIPTSLVLLILKFVLDFVQKELVQSPRFSIIFYIVAALLMIFIDFEAVLVGGMFATIFGLFFLPAAWYWGPVRTVGDGLIWIANFAFMGGIAGPLVKRMQVKTNKPKVKTTKTKS